MKKNVWLTWAFLFIVLVVVSPVAAKKAGEIKDNVYLDGNYKFSLNVPAGWSPTIKDEKSPVRLVMMQSSYPVPTQFQDRRDYAQIPTMTVLYDTTSLTAEQFVDTLLDNKSKSKQRAFFVKNMPLISKTHDILKRSTGTLGNAKTVTLEVRQKYALEVAQAGSDMADVINDYKAGTIFVAVKDGKVFVFHSIAEYQLISSYQTIFGGTIASIKFE